jgi:hypothetical protein
MGIAMLISIIIMLLTLMLDVIERLLSSVFSVIIASSNNYVNTFLLPGNKNCIF